MEETYYKKILVSSGEVPEENGWYITDEGSDYYRAGFGGGWFDNEYDPDAKTYPDWYLKPVPSPKQEALEFAEWKDRQGYELWGSNGKEDLYGKIGKPYNKPFTLSELYDKFKEKGESK